MAAFTPWLVVLIAVALVPAVLNEWHFTKAGYRLAWIRSPERRRIDYLRYLGASVEIREGDQALRPLRTTSPASTRCWRAGCSCTTTAASPPRRAGWGFAFASLGTLAYYAAYAVIVWRTVAGAISRWAISSSWPAAFQRLRGGLEGLLLGFTQITGQAQYLDDFFSFFAIRPRDPLARAAGAGAEPDPGGAGLRGRSATAIPAPRPGPCAHLSFTVRAGETVALVGGNGAGKTTIVKLMTRLYDPHEGRVLLDGLPLAAYDLDDPARRAIGRDLPGLRPLRPHRRRERRGRPDRGRRRRRTGSPRRPHGGSRPR